MNRKTFIICLLLLGYVTTWAQTNKHVKVPGTKCAIVLPKGFTPASSFGGFQEAASGASIMINEIPMSYESAVEGFTAEALKSKGMTLIGKQTVPVDESSGTLYQVKQVNNGLIYLKQILVFGDKNHVILANGIYPESSKAVAPKIKEALLSTIYDSAQKEDPLEAATFVMDVTGTAFAPVKYMAGMVIYSTDGQIATGKPTLMVGNSVADIGTNDRKKYAEERLMNLPDGGKSVIKNINAITVDNLAGYEIIADGKTKDKETARIYQVMLFTAEGDQYYVIMGHTKEDFDRYTAVFQQITKTFKRK